VLVDPERFACHEVDATDVGVHLEAPELLPHHVVQLHHLSAPNPLESPLHLELWEHIQVPALQEVVVQALVYFHTHVEKTAAQPPLLFSSNGHRSSRSNLLKTGTCHVLVHRGSPSAWDVEACPNATA